MRANPPASSAPSRTVQILTGTGEHLDATLTLPAAARGLVLFAHGSGSSRHSPRNRFVASVLEQHRLGTLLLDLLTAAEDPLDQATRQLRFDIDLLASRLAAATDWARHDSDLRTLGFGYFGASTGAAAALMAAAARDDIGAVVSRGGRPDLAGASLALVTAPVLLIVGELDTAVLDLNRMAFATIPSARRLEIVPGATHLFEEPGALEVVAGLAADWFVRYL